MKSLLYRIAVSLLLSALLIGMCAAHADTYELREPTGGELKSDEAVAIARDFMRDLTGVELTGLYVKADGRRIEGKTEAYFGPGSQWLADTEDDCWALVIRNETRIRPFVVVHGTTGEVVYWEYTDEETNQTFINLLPQDGQLTDAEAVVLAEKRFAAAMRGAPAIDPERLANQTAFGMAGNWCFDKPEYESLPAWLVQLTYTDDANQEYFCETVLAADGGALLRFTVSVYGQEMDV